jgi:hypothetical protein
MKDEASNQGTPANGGHKSSTGEGRRHQYRGPKQQRRIEMKYSISVLDKARILGDKEFLFSQIQRHFETWQSRALGSSFVLRWRGPRLVLSTNSEELVERWQQIERHYVEYMLSAKPTIEDDMSDLVCYPADWWFNSAA